MRKRTRFIRWFEDITIDDVPSVGGKTASLREMYRELTPQGVRNPNGLFPEDLAAEIIPACFDCLVERTGRDRE